MTDDILRVQEFLIRVEASANLDGDKELPTVDCWVRETSHIDTEVGVRYATYIKVVNQEVTGEGPDVDALADQTTDLELVLEATVRNDISYEKRVYLISHPIAVWHTSSDPEMTDAYTDHGRVKRG